MPVTPQDVERKAKKEADQMARKTTLQGHIRRIEEQLITQTRESGIVGCIWSVPYKDCPEYMVNYIMEVFKEAGWFVAGFRNTSGYNMEFRRSSDELSKPDKNRDDPRYSK